MTKKLFKNPLAVVTLGIILAVILIGIFADIIAPNDPNAVNIMNKFDGSSSEFPLGTDNLGRCIFSRIIWGVRTSIGLSAITMAGTIGLGLLFGLLAGYFRGIVDEVIMRFVDVLLAFPSQIIVFAVVGLLGINIVNVILASILIKWAWYARMIRTNVVKYREMSYVNYSRIIGSKETFVMFRHILPAIAAETVMLASLDMGWSILNISTLSFLGVGVQAPTAEWGAMLNTAKEVFNSNPTQMIPPGIAIVVMVCLFNLLGDVLRDVLDPKEVM